ncbi:hypothetical protein IMSHALPRED_003017 [Imshaugia aleurites]|uniref:Uncharacterized protein n=1 Tax=Imshaugia aleurites TaxID=172621 RepID=A0A8H3IF47_9LECA|nr:hypothetical protein IMSHALPRED_003017 [Imshaugia aleurites]
MEGKQLEEELFYGEVNNNWKHDAVLVRKIMENCSEEVRKVIFDTGCFTDGGRERLFNHIRRGNRGSALGLLLTLLPNLALMRFNRSTGSARQFKKIVQRITKPCGRKSSATHEKGSRVLTKLREVEFRGIDPRPEGWNAYEDFDHARHFTKLPSMRKVSAGFAKSPSQLSKDSWIEVGSRASNIDEISGVATILGALLEHAKTSLEFLDLTENWSPPEDDKPIHTSLKSFEKLKEAKLNCELYAPAYNEREDDGGKSILVLVHAGEKLIGIRSDDSESRSLHTSKLVDMLPSSIMSIEFYGRVAMKHVKAMLQGLVEHRADHLPQLEKFVFTEQRDGRRQRRKWPRRCSKGVAKLVSS